MRILHITSLYKPESVGGAELFVHSLATAQVRAGHQVAVATTSRNGEPTVIDDGVKIYRMGHTTPFFVRDWSTQPKWKRIYYKISAQINNGIDRLLAQVIKDFNPDVINTHSLSELPPAVWNCAMSRQLPLAHTLHDYSSMCTNGSLYHGDHICDGARISCRLISWHHKRSQSGVNAVIGVGKDVLQRHITAGFFDHVDPSLRRVEWNGLSPPASTRRLRPPQPGGVLVFGYLGRIEAAKGADFLLEALKRMPSIENWRLIMAGRITESESRYRTLCNGLPVEFPGYLEADEFFESIDCLIVPSLWPETFGRTVAEARLRGVPVIGSNLGGIAEQMMSDSRNMLFQPGSSEELIEIIQAYMADPTAYRVDDATILQLQKDVDINRIAEHYTNIYRLLLSRGTDAVV